MATRLQQTRSVGPGQAAIVVRLVAFVMAGCGVLAVPAVLVAANLGQVTHLQALYLVGGAVAAIGLAFAVVRPFDPLRG